VSDGWWNDNESNVGDYDPAQTAATQGQLDPNTTYAPPGTAAPIDQYNFVPDPGAPGGYQTYGPGQVAPVDLAAFSNQSGQYPNSGDMGNAVANNLDLYPTITADGAANLGGYQQLPQQEQQSWQDLYGASLAPYAWGQQTGNYNVPAAQQGFNSLPYEEQNTWYGTYGEQAPAIWAQQAAAAGGYGGQPPTGPNGGNGPTGTWGPGGFNYGASMGPYPSSPGYGGGYGTPWNNPWSIGAGVSEIPYGWGVPGFGQDPIQIRPEYLDYLNQQTTGQRGGYIPGSGTFNQWNLSAPGLLGTVGGQQNMNLRYGQGGTGDPTTGLEAQTPQEWVQGGKLFNTTRTSSWGQGDQAGTGLDYIANLFMRSDTPSGIGTPAWSAPKAYWDGLAQQIAQGTVQPTARGWQALQAKGYTPQGIGGAAPAAAQAAGAAAGGAGGQGPMGPGTQAFNYQAAYLDYMNARMNMLEIPGMKNQDERARDQLAFEQAKQKWLEQYQQQTFGEGQRQFNELQGLRAGELTGSYNGQQTLASRAEQNQTGLGYLNLLSQLRGPGDIFQYLKVLQGTPGGMRDIVNAASGAYRMPGTGGGNVTVGGGVNTGGAANLNSLLDQMNNPNYGAEGTNLNLPLPNQINAQALQRMSPSQQQSLFAAYEAAGYNPQDVMSIFRNSLPQYAGGGGAGRVGLFGR
jgi:hypothetical protein